MPIYAYRCSACGHEKDVLQKISAEPLTLCPACNTENFSKQITAAGFQLKGSGWYASDFKGGAGSSSSASNTVSSSESSAPASPCGGSCACH
ncbi:MAG: zinc ribbon domain-containing protein [Rhodocyclaceae bacterium]|nr:zinc ribbon domain-containing protein [Rhodocyclaceae bacterium]